jgi:hypothetical protein
LISRSAAVSTCAIFLATVAPIMAQQGPLKDPIPLPIPQSHIRVSLQPVIVGLTSPIYMTVSIGDPTRGYIVDQTGLILLAKNGVLQGTPFLNITNIVSQISPAFGSGPNGLNPAYDERGLLGLAFHPGFNDSTSPGFQTLYTLHNVPIGRRADFEEPPFTQMACPAARAHGTSRWEARPYANRGLESTVDGYLRRVA